ncbi:hypothetical protein [Acidovorax sp. SUPP2539]|uniref:hypothetical protein n=1 Tax=Acidovorax sp. SUPP2539 TaxID=2920878 RepID=UPI0023DE65B1|nr:hypothetical protein [Acidovorax sp. SUPP2539]GKS88144.1 hypothetical protein AVTE2539_02285 [Acidovorax sp. SUPP2539]
MSETAQVAIATGILTLIGSLFAQSLSAWFESKREERKARLRQDEKAADARAAQAQNKLAKLVELWNAVALSRQRLSDGFLKKNIGGQIEPPEAKDSAATAASTVYGLALLYFPDIRPYARDYHIEVVKVEAAFWFNQVADEEAAWERLEAVSLKLTAGIEQFAQRLEKTSSMSSDD